MQSSKFIVVCGPQRSGTRQFSDFLNRDYRICLQGEVSPVLFPKIYDLVSAADEAYSSSKHEKNYKDKRKRIVEDMFAYFSKAKYHHKPSATIEGFKTPHAEFHYHSLNEVITPSYEELSYLYCVRNLKNTYLSLTAMPWFGLSADKYFKKYIKSLRLATEMKEKLSSNININAILLDDFVSSAEKATWLSEKLFKPLGLDISITELEEYVKTTKNTNSTKNRFGAERPTEISEEDYKVYLEYKSKIVYATKKFNAAFGTNLDNDF